METESICSILFQEDSESTDLEQFHQREVTHPPSSALSTPGDDGSTTSRSVTPSPIVLRPKRKKNLTPTDEVIQLAGQQLKAIRPDDEFEAYGKYIAHKLRSLKGNQAVFARKLINDVIFEGELEALTKDFKVMNSHPHRSFEKNDYQQFNPQLYPQQPYPYHQFSYPQVPYPQQHNPRPSNNVQRLNTILPNSQTNKLEQPNYQQPNSQEPNSQHTNYQQPETQQPESQQPNSQQSTYSNNMSSSSNIDPNQSMENNVSTYFSNCSV